MTTLQHRILDNQGQPVAGRLATVAAYQPDMSKVGAYQRFRAVSAVSGSDGWLTWTLPSVPGFNNPTYAVTGIEARQVLVTVPRSVSTATVNETRVGTIPLQAGAAASVDLVTESELTARLAGIGSGLVLSPTAPTAPAPGTVWINTSF